MRKRSVRIDNDFEQMVISAERYACGRQTYIVSVVSLYILSLVPHLSTKTLKVLRMDLDGRKDADKMGDRTIDKPMWVNLLRKVEEEIVERETLERCKVVEGDVLVRHESDGHCTGT